MRALDPDPDASAWGDQEHLLALIVDVLQAANWQRGGNARAPKPKPLPRPGETRKHDQRLARLAEKWKTTTEGDR